MTVKVVEFTGPVVRASVAPGSHDPTGHPLSTLNPVTLVESSVQVTVIVYWPCAPAVTFPGVSGAVAGRNGCKNAAALLV